MGTNETQLKNLNDKNKCIVQNTVPKFSAATGGIFWGENLKKGNNNQFRLVFEGMIPYKA